MTERWMVRLALTATLMLGSFLASAAEGGTKLLQAGNDLLRAEDSELGGRTGDVDLHEAICWQSPEPLQARRRLSA